MLLHFNHFKKQTGAALLAFMLLIIIGSSYFLITKLNTNLALTQQSVETGIALKSAKDALIGYAITFPDHDVSGVIDGPGYLPCPDLNNDDSAASNCSVGGNTTIGRLPNQTLRLEELRDASGQRLWYALSENFRFGNNKTIPLNSESPSSAELSVNGTGDIVAVIIAPGVPVNGQSRDPSDTSITSEISNYLEGDNNNLDTSFVTTLGGTTRKDGEYDANDNYIFNDRLVVITRQELMEAVKKRVTGEVSQFLTTYVNTHGAYPWLTPFADPKASKPPLSGEHDGGNGAANLSDSGRDFNVWGVTNGDVVRNVTDGSIGTVTAVAATTLTIAGGLSLGTENDFDDDDEYYIYPAALSNQLMGTATNANDNASLEDTNNDFNELDITPGDIVDNITDGSSGVVDSVSANELTFITLPNTLTLSGGTENDFDNGDSYRIRSQHGQATADTDANGLTLEDTNNNFTVMGIQIGDLVVNITDGSTGRVSIVAANTLTIDDLKFGSDNIFEVNDYYSLPRYNADNNTREGLLTFHEVGETFKTGLNFDWAITTVSVGDITVSNSTILQNYMQNYAASSSESFDDSIGTCIWLLPDIADCYGYFKDFVNISGTLTSGSDTDIITDSTAQFSTDGVKRGDIAQNYDDESSVISGIADTGSAGTTLVDAAVDFSVYEPYSYVIQNITLATDLSVTRIQGIISDIIDANTLVVVSYVGQDSTPIEFRVGDSYIIYQPVRTVVTSVPSQDQLNTSGYTQTDSIIFPYFPDFDNGEYYRVMPAANSYSGTVTSVVSTGTPDRFRDTSANFLTEGISVGDIIENTTTGAFGEIIALITDGIETTLYNGPPNDFTVGDFYTVYHDYVFSREHIFHAKFRGNQGTNTVSEERVRDVCLGYTSDCSALSTAVNFTGNGGDPFITVVDYEEDEITEVGRATFIPSAASSGSIRVSDIDYYLQEADGELPDWFITNKWHQLVYIAFDSGDSPNGGADCIPISTNAATTNPCLTLTGGGSPDDNKRAIVISAGEPLEDLNQDRTSGDMTDYYELENNDQLIDIDDDNFQTGDIINTFNDQVRILDTSP